MGQRDGAFFTSSGERSVGACSEIRRRSGFCPGLNRLQWRNTTWPERGGGCSGFLCLRWQAGGVHIVSISPAHGRTWNVFKVNWQREKLIVHLTWHWYENGNVKNGAGTVSGYDRLTWSRKKHLCCYCPFRWPHQTPCCSQGPFCNLTLLPHSPTTRFCDRRYALLLKNQ